MALFDFIQRLLGLQKPSATMAKERLQLVLAHDRSDLNPELLEQMRREILEVVQKYVEIDLEGGEVSLATEDRVTALVANLPIRRARAVPLDGLKEGAASDVSKAIEVPSPSSPIPTAAEATQDGPLEPLVADQPAIDTAPSDTDPSEL
jgi:cell division topological specificity factor